MKTTQIKPFLSETVVADVMQVIQSKSARLAATYPDDLHSTSGAAPLCAPGHAGTRPSVGRLAPGAGTGSSRR